MTRESYKPSHSLCVAPQVRIEVIHINASSYSYHTSFLVRMFLDYMSPEMVLRHGHNTSVDSWALGVLLCELLSGYAPFTLSTTELVASSLCRSLKRRKSISLPAGSQAYVTQTMTHIADCQVLYVLFANEQRSV